MGHHFTRNTVSAEAWCGKCEKHTQHKVTDRRLAHCLECFARQTEIAQKPKEESPEEKQGGLF